MTNMYDYAFIKRGTNRIKVMNSLKDGKKTQAEIHKITGLYRTHVRRSIDELVRKKFVKCLNPKDRIYKLYELTEKGRIVMNEISNEKKS